MRVGNIHKPQAGVDVTEVPTEGQTQTLRRQSDPITPPQIRSVDDDGTQLRMMRLIIQTRRKTGKDHAAAQTASVHDTADVATQTADGGRHDRSQQPRPNEHEESSHDEDSNPCLDDKESNALSGRLVCSKRNHVVVPQTEPDSLEAGKDDCQTPRRPVDPACLQLEPININQAKRIPEPRKTSQEMGRTSTCNQTDPTDNHDLTSDMTWLTTAEDSSKWDAMESDFKSSRLKQPARPTTPYHHDCDNSTNSA